MSYSKRFKEFKLLISKRQQKGNDFAVQKCLLNVSFRGEECSYSSCMWKRKAEQEPVLQAKQIRE